MKNFKKTVNLYSVPCEKNDKQIQVFIFIEYTDGSLSISGVEGPKADGNSLGNCGQINIETNKEKITPNSWATLEHCILLLKIWDKYHLNDFQAGTPLQELAAETFASKNDDYNTTLEKLKKVNAYTTYIDDDRSKYKYGSDWLKLEVPEDILHWLYDLTEEGSTKIPAKWVF